MWVVIELEKPTTNDPDPFRVYGPFDDRDAAEHYCQLRNFDGVMKLHPPEE